MSVCSWQGNRKNKALNAVQTAVDAHVQLTTAASHDELPVPLVAHLALEMTVHDLGKFPATAMLTVVSIAKLLLHLNNTALAFGWSYVQGSCSVHDLFGVSDQVSLEPEGAVALARRLPLCSTNVTELGSTFASMGVSLISDRFLM